MSILSDIEIEKLCVPPKNVFLFTCSSIDRSKYPVGTLLSKEIMIVSRKETGPSIVSVLADTEEGATVKLKIALSYMRSSFSLFPENTFALSNKTAATQEDYNIFGWKPMISPFEVNQVKSRKREDGSEEKLISYGLSSYGYDIRAAPEFRVFTNVNSTLADPKNFDSKSFVEVNEDKVIIPPNSFALARSLEEFHIPRDVMTVCLGKSTLARVGCVVGVTPFEPEWSGYATLEFSNTTPLPMVLYANEGCAQILFFRGNMCRTSYADRKGKYQNQAPEPIAAKL